MRRRTFAGVVRIAALMSGAGCVLGVLGTCDDRLVALTNYVDPCGTVLGNCTPGQFQFLNSDIGSYCLDPTCTVPGQCEGIVLRDYCKRR